MVDIQCFTVGAFQVNTYLLTDDVTGISAIVDTGESNELPERLVALPELPNVQKIFFAYAWSS